MNSEGCWSTVVCRPAERAALGLGPDAEWLVQCRLAIGHRGNHATDASTHPRHDRRLWLEWNDFDDRAQSLIERNPCPIRSPEGSACVFFHGHGGPHFYARSNGHVPAVMSGSMAAGHVGVTGPATTPPDQVRAGTHRLPEPPEQTPTAPPPEPVYRGGRRSTNAEPPPGFQNSGRRHRLEDTGLDHTEPVGAGLGEAALDGAAGTSPPPPVDGLADPGTQAARPQPARPPSRSGSASQASSAPAVDRDAEIAAILDELAVVVGRLAALLRRD